MELNFLLLEQRRLEDEIAAAGERGDYERRAALSRERAALVERIAHAAAGRELTSVNSERSGRLRATPFRGSSIGRAFDC